jgi:DNA repair protein RecN (Recombination protein N)
MSLKHIRLRDFVIVRELELDLAEGFCVLTGETGAGKSILIDALQLALGARADAIVVREGANRAEISVEFDTVSALVPWLDAAGFDAGSSLLLRRTVDAQGKSRAWINGGQATATQLRELGEQLVDIHGQHAWQSLTRPDALRRLLDAYAGLDTDSVTQNWHGWRTAKTVLNEAQTAQASLQEERERLAWQISELDKLTPLDGEWEELNSQHGRLANAQTLIEAAQAAALELDNEETGALRSITQSLHRLQGNSHLQAEFAEIAEVLTSSLAQAQDATHSLHAWRRRIEIDPDRLAVLDERLTLWVSLARRFKRTPAELAATHTQWRADLARLDAATDLEMLTRAERQAQAVYMEAAATLSKARSRAAVRLAKSVTQTMQGLGMQGGIFEVALQSVPPGPHGLDEVTFLVAGHAGSTPRPVAKVASGGELSRIALAIAVTTSQLGTAQTLIFDEVDAGVGGAVAETVGRLMKQLGTDRQVMAVTHLPQVAACADHHLVVSKQVSTHGAESAVTPVTGEQRVAEIARMLGGERLSNTTLAHARELLG